MNKKMKKYRKITAIMLAAAAISMTVSACRADNGTSGADNSTSAVSSGFESSSAVNKDEGSSIGESSATEQSGDNSAQQSGTSDSAQSLSEALREQIARAYGDDYLPDTPIPAEMLEAEFGLTEDMYDEIFAQMPTIGFHPDRLVIVKPAAGKEEEVKNALETAKKNFIENSVQYPQNIAKVNAAEVLKGGDYYCFMMLGAPMDMSIEDEAEQAAFAEEQMKIGKQAFEQFFAENR